MSRLGDLLRTERMRRNMTHKQVAKLGGVSEGYLKDVEAGTRIIADDQARRILKKMGLSEQNEAGFSLDDIAATVDLGTVNPSLVKDAANPKRGAGEDKRGLDKGNRWTSEDNRWSEKDNRGPSNEKPVFSTLTDEEKPQTAGGVWLDALTSVLRRVPIYNGVMKEIDHRLLPVLDGRIEGASPDKVFFLSAPDDSMRGFRILRDDLCLIVPAGSPIDDAVMLVEVNGRRSLRKVKTLGAIQVLLQSYDREHAAETFALPDVNFVGRVAKVEFAF